jgi:hypothetical protein
MLSYFSGRVEMDTEQLLAALDRLLDRLPEYVSGGDSDLMERVKNVVGEFNGLDIFFRRLSRLLKMINEGTLITDADDVILVNAWDECNPDLDKFIRRMHSLREIPKIIDPVELPEYLSDVDFRVREAAKLKLDELRELKAMVSEQVIERDKTGG